MFVHPDLLRSCRNWHSVFDPCWLLLLIPPLHLYIVKQGMMPIMAMWARDNPTITSPVLSHEISITFTQRRHYTYSKYPKIKDWNRCSTRRYQKAAYCGGGEWEGWGGLSRNNMEGCVCVCVCVCVGAHTKGTTKITLVDPCKFSVKFVSRQTPTNCVCEPYQNGANMRLLVCCYNIACSGNSIELPLIHVNIYRLRIFARGPYTRSQKQLITN